MRISDWSSDVCSSDLVAGGLVVSKGSDTQVSVSPGLAIDANGADLTLLDGVTVDLGQSGKAALLLTAAYNESDLEVDRASGRAPGRERECRYESISVVAV